MDLSAAGAIPGFKLASSSFLLVLVSPADGCHTRGVRVVYSGFSRLILNPLGLHGQYAGVEVGRNS